LRWCSQYPNPFGGEDSIERGGEPGVPIAHQELHRVHAVPEVHHQVAAAWRVHAPLGWAVIPAGCTRRSTRRCGGGAQCRRAGSRPRGWVRPVGLGPVSRWDRLAAVSGRGRPRAGCARQSRTRSGAPVAPTHPGSGGGPTTGSPWPCGTRVV
jgi:hypothetical protein